MEYIDPQKLGEILINCSTKSHYSAAIVFNNREAVRSLYLALSAVSKEVGIAEYRLHELEGYAYFYFSESRSSLRAFTAHSFTTTDITRPPTDGMRFHEILLSDDVYEYYDYRPFLSRCMVNLKSREANCWGSVAPDDYYHSDELDEFLGEFTVIKNDQ